MSIGRAVVTGAARGIGLAVARALANNGYELLLSDRDPDAGPGIDKLSNTGAAVTYLSVDLSHPDTAERSLRDAIDDLGSIDALVTCAGIHRCGPSESAAWQDWDEVLAVNLGGTYAAIRAALPIMLEQGSGRIVTIASELGIAGMPEYAAHCASKGGVIALTKALAREYAPRGIRVNSVAPGPVDTQMLRESPEYDDSHVPDLPVGRYGTVDEIAATVELLVGPGGDFYVGQVLSPNGGAVI
jgi:NAD(P)-dependent dehydrogenase (short-subunit alcohol dehydrogenase family)